MMTTMTVMKILMIYIVVGWFEFNVPFQHKYGYIRDEIYKLLSIMS